jgi:hypothetical protein
MSYEVTSSSFLRRRSFSRQTSSWSRSNMSRTENRSWFSRLSSWFSLMYSLMRATVVAGSSSFKRLLSIFRTVAGVAMKRREETFLSVSCERWLAGRLSASAAPSPSAPRRQRGRVRGSLVVCRGEYGNGRDGVVSVKRVRRRGQQCNIQSHVRRLKSALRNAV